jgi:hypothetical protein
MNVLSNTTIVSEAFLGQSFLVPAKFLKIIIMLRLRILVPA